MIVKKIPALGAGPSRGHAEQVRDLVDYLNLEDKDAQYAEQLIAYLQGEGIETDDAERLYHIGARNFVTTTTRNQKVEMMGTASQAYRSPNPLDHWLLSWKESERPTPAQLERSAEIFLNHLGLRDHQAIFAAHSDTHNIHLHIAVNRYDPFSRKMTEVNGGWTREAGHQAIALIVDEQGWEPETRARYSVVDGALTRSARADQARLHGDKSISADASAFEVRTGLKSAERVAIEVAAPIIRSAITWPDLHARLARQGIAYLQSGSGAVLSIDNKHVKASTAHRDCALTRLEKRMGSFRARSSTVYLTDRSPAERQLPEAVRAIEFDEYRNKPRDEGRAAIRAEASGTMRRAVAEAHSQARADRGALKDLQDGGRSMQRTALRDVIEEEEHAAIEAARARHRATLEQLKSENSARDYETWLRQQSEHYLADRWRQGGRRADWTKAFDTERANNNDQITQISGYEAHRVVGGTRYAKKGQPTAFIVWPKSVEVTLPGNDDATLAAFRLAVARNGGPVSICGSQQFQEQAFALIAAHGLADQVTNQDLKQAHSALHVKEAAAPGSEIEASLERKRSIVAKPVHEPQQNSVGDEGASPDLIHEFMKRRGRGIT